MLKWLMSYFEKPKTTYHRKKGLWLYMPMNGEEWCYLYSDGQGYLFGSNRVCGDMHMICHREIAEEHEGSMSFVYDMPYTACLNEGWLRITDREIKLSDKVVSF